MHSHSGRFPQMDRTLAGLIDYQHGILQNFPPRTVSVKSDPSISTAESDERTLDQRPWPWKMKSQQMITVLVCSTSARARGDINEDLEQALQTLNQRHSQREKYAFMHTGRYLYAIGKSLFKFDIRLGHVQSTENPHPGRCQFGLAANSRQFVLVGGWMDQNSCTLSCMRFDCQTDQWHILPDIPIRSRQGFHSPGVCFIGRRAVIVMGGALPTTAGSIAMRKCFHLSLTRRKWRSIAPCHEARAKPMLIYHSGLIYAIGGVRYLYDQHRVMTTIHVTSIEQWVTKCLLQDSRPLLLCPDMIIRQINGPLSRISANFAIRESCTVLTKPFSSVLIPNIIDGPMIWSNNILPVTWGYPRNETSV